MFPPYAKNFQTSALTCNNTIFVNVVKSNFWNNAKKIHYSVFITKIIAKLKSIDKKLQKPPPQALLIHFSGYIGGVMGLFLGMSCVTLLEVFIYLFKTIFGTLNSTRHKAFIERLLSNEDGSIHGSHEEIIITQKM